MVADGDTVKRKIRELRVVELRNELENRGLDKTGVKALLVDRLTKVHASFSLLSCKNLLSLML